MHRSKPKAPRGLHMLMSKWSLLFINTSCLAVRKLESIKVLHMVHLEKCLSLSWLHFRVFSPLVCCVVSALKIVLYWPSHSGGISDSQYPEALRAAVLSCISRALCGAHNLHFISNRWGAEHSWPLQPAQSLGEPFSFPFCDSHLGGKVIDWKQIIKLSQESVVSCEDHRNVVHFFIFLLED